MAPLSTLAGPSPARKPDDAIRIAGMPPTNTPRPGRPRDPAKDDAAIAATLELLGEVGFCDLRIDDVAARAAVPKSTIYRRWPSLHALVVDAYRTVFPPPRLSATDNPLADLDALIDYYVDMLSSSSVGRWLPFTGATVVQQPELRDDYRTTFVEPYMAELTSIISRGTAEGTFKPSLEPAAIASMLYGCCTFEMLFYDAAPSAAQIKTNARALLGVVPA